MAENPTIYSAWCDAGKTWKAVAIDAGCTYPTLTNWRRMRVKVPENRWSTLARALDVDPERFDREAYRAEYDAHNAAQSAANEAHTPVQHKQAPATPETPPEAPAAPKSWFDALFGDDE